MDQELRSGSARVAQEQWKASGCEFMNRHAPLLMLAREAAHSTMRKQNWQFRGLEIGSKRDPGRCDPFG